MNLFLYSTGFLALAISINSTKTSKGAALIQFRILILATNSFFCKTLQRLRINSFNELNYAIKINTGRPKVIDVRGHSISRGVHNGIAFANFKAHKFSYLNIKRLGTDYVLNGKECAVACVNIPSCFSFNLAAFYDINGRILCELLPSDKYNNSDKFISSQLFHHFSIGVSTSLTAGLFEMHFDKN
jgi:hypothetical protein